MASVSMAMSLPTATKNLKTSSISQSFLNPSPLKAKVVSMKSNNTRAGTVNFQVKASSLKEKAVTGLTAAALTASMMIPDAAEAAASGVTPSLNNFLLSIASGGLVLGVIFGAVIGVSYFDPVKRT